MLRDKPKGEQVILEEVIDETYEPTSAEVGEYAQWLGLDVDKEKNLVWIAREGLKAPLPKEWKPCQNAQGELYYFNFKTGESIWDHPCDEYYKNLYERERKKASTIPPEENASVSPQRLSPVALDPLSPLGTRQAKPARLQPLSPAEGSPLSPFHSPFRGVPSSLNFDQGPKLSRLPGKGLYPVTPLTRAYTSTSSTTPSTEGRRNFSPDSPAQKTLDEEGSWGRSQALDGAMEAIRSKEEREIDEEEILEGLNSELENVPKEKEVLVKVEDTNLEEVKKKKESIVQKAKGELRYVELQQKTCLEKIKEELEDVNKEREECLSRAREELEEIKLEGQACLERTKAALLREEEQLYIKHKQKMEALKEEGGADLERERGEYGEALAAMREAFRVEKETRKESFEREAGELDAELRCRQAEEIERIRESSNKELEEQKKQVFQKLEKERGEILASLEEELQEWAKEMLRVQQEKKLAVKAHLESLDHDDKDENELMRWKAESCSSERREINANLQDGREDTWKHELDSFKAAIQEDLHQQKLLFEAMHQEALTKIQEDIQVEQKAEGSRLQQEYMAHAASLLERYKLLLETHEVHCRQLSSMETQTSSPFPDTLPGEQFDLPELCKGIEDRFVSTGVQTSMTECNFAAETDFQEPNLILGNLDKTVMQHVSEAVEDIKEAIREVLKRIEALSPSEDKPGIPETIKEYVRHAISESIEDKIPRINEQLLTFIHRKVQRRRARHSKPSRTERLTKADYCTDTTLSTSCYSDDGYGIAPPNQVQMFPLSPNSTARVGVRNKCRRRAPVTLQKGCEVAGLSLEAAGRFIQLQKKVIRDRRKTLELSRERWMIQWKMLSQESDSNILHAKQTVLLDMWEILEGQAQRLNLDISSLESLKIRVRSLDTFIGGKEASVVSMLSRSLESRIMPNLLEDLCGVGSIDALNDAVDKTIAFMHPQSG